MVRGHSLTWRDVSATNSLGSEHMTYAWVVLLEVSCHPGANLLVETVEALLGRLDGRYPSALHAVDRCAVQFLVDAQSPDQALVEGLAMWCTAAGDVDFPPADVVRAEVKTPAELDAEYEEEARTLLSHIPVDARATAAAYDFTRRLLQSRTPREVTSALQALVRQLGGVVVSPRPGDPRILTVDLCLAEAPPMAAAAEPFSVARLDLEEVLPAAIEDARRVVRLLRAAVASPLAIAELE